MLFVSSLRTFKAQLLHKPVLVVTLDEVCNRYAKLLKGTVGSAIDDLLVESPIKALCNTVDAISSGSNFARLRYHKMRVTYSTFH